MNFDDRISSMEHRNGIVSINGDDWSGEFCDMYVTIGSDGRVRMTWTRPQKVQLEAPADASCTSDVSGQIRCFEQDLRPPDARRIPSAILFRRASAKLQEMFAAAIDGSPISADDLQLRRELDDERAEAYEREREELSILGIDPSEVDAAFAQGGI
jgi:hypothetical protein